MLMMVLKIGNCNILEQGLVDFEVYGSKIYTLTPMAIISLFFFMDPYWKKQLEENFIDISPDQYGVLLTKRDKIVYLNKDNLDETLAEKTLSPLLSSPIHSKLLNGQSFVLVKNTLKKMNYLLFIQKNLQKMFLISK